MSLVLTMWERSSQIRKWIRQNKGDLILITSSQMVAWLLCELWEGLWFLVMEWNKTETILPALIINGARQGKWLFFSSHTVRLYYRHEWNFKPCGLLGITFLSDQTYDFHMADENNRLKILLSHTGEETQIILGSIKLHLDSFKLILLSNQVKTLAKTPTIT